MFSYYIYCWLYFLSFFINFFFSFCVCTPFVWRKSLNTNRNYCSLWAMEIWNGFLVKLSISFSWDFSLSELLTEICVGRKLYWTRILLEAASVLRVELASFGSALKSRWLSRRYRFKQMAFLVSYIALSDGISEKLSRLFSNPALLLFSILL